MNSRQRLDKISLTNPSTSVHNSFIERPFILPLVTESNTALTKQDIENQQFQQNKLEATKLQIQAKYGTLTPEGQDRLTVLQAKEAEFWQQYREKTGRFGFDFAKIPITRPLTPSQPALQTKLTIGEPGDKYEQEADRVAAEVVNQINTPVAQQFDQPIQREVKAEEEEEEEIKRKSEISSDRLQLAFSLTPRSRHNDGDGGIYETLDLETSIQQARGSGQPLANKIREPMEQAFGADFSGVKVHTDAHADVLNKRIQARAFTTGQDVFFRQGEYNPGSRGGQELIAHELTHVVQQNGGTINRLMGTELLDSPTILFAEEAVLKHLVEFVSEFHAYYDSRKNAAIENHKERPDNASKSTLIIIKGGHYESLISGEALRDKLTTNLSKNGDALGRYSVFVPQDIIFKICTTEKYYDGGQTAYNYTEEAPQNLLFEGEYDGFVFRIDHYKAT